MSDVAEALDYGFVGSGLHTAFRKALDGPASSVLFNVVHLLPDEDWARFADDVALALRGGRFDAESLRRACLDHGFPHDPDVGAKRRCTRNILGAGLKCLTTKDWVAIASFLREGSPDLAARGNEDGAAIAEAAWRKDLGITVHVTGGDASVLAEVMPWGKARVAVHVIGADFEVLENATLEEGVARAREAVRALAYASRIARVDPARVDAMRRVSVATSLDAGDALERKLAEAGVTGTVLLRKPTMFRDEGPGLTAFILDPSSGDPVAWHVSQRGGPVRVWKTLAENMRGRLALGREGRGRDTMDEDMTAAVMTLRRSDAGDVEASGAIFDYVGDTPRILFEGPWISLPGFMDRVEEGEPDVVP